MDKKESIKKLQDKRFYLRDKIRSYVKDQKNAYEIVLEYHNILSQLRDHGVHVENRADYLQLEYWVKSVTNEERVNIQNDSKNNYFSLCLAWTSINGCQVPTQVKIVKEYFDELGLKLDDEDIRQTNAGYSEYVLKYEFEGPEESFRLLKICTQFILDTFAETDFDKFNIAVYGKRKNY